LAGSATAQTETAPLSVRRVPVLVFEVA
jgi:hypothetical protein